MVMTSDLYTVFLSDSRNVCSIYSGAFSNHAAALATGDLAYNIYLRLPRLIISSQQLDIADDATLVPGMATYTEGNRVPMAVANVNPNHGRGAQVSINGKEVKVEQRVGGVGWKFTDLSGIKYKWEVLRKEKRWDLVGHRGKVVASFDSAQFWSDNHASFSIDEGIDEDLRMLVLLSWALSAKSIFMSKSVNANNVSGGSDTFTNALAGRF